MRIKISTNYVLPIERQTPGGSCRWRGVDFQINCVTPECDAWIVHEGVATQESTLCPPGKLFLLTCEPPCIKRYNPAWLDTFSAVVSCHDDISHTALRVSQTGLPWLVNKSYDELNRLDYFEKSGDISVICSNKMIAPGHCNRYEAVSKLAELLPLDWYGRGATELKDKWDGLAPYRYSIAIENSAVEHYWTEKISDCFLAYTIPLYWGCPNIHEYFPPESYIKLESLDPSYIKDVVMRCATELEYQRRLNALQKARELVLSEYNFFNLATQLAGELTGGDGAKQLTIVNPERFFRKPRLKARLFDLLRLLDRRR